MSIKVTFKFEEDDCFSMERLKVLTCYDDYPLAIWEIKEFIFEAQNSGRIGNKVISEMSADDLLEVVRSTVFRFTENLPTLS